MANSAKLENDNSLTVIEDLGGGQMRSWSMRADQIAAHRKGAGFEALLTAKAKSDIAAAEAAALDALDEQ